MDSLFKKIIKLSLANRDYIILKIDRKKTICVKGTEDNIGIVIFAREERDFVIGPIEPIVERLIIRNEGDFINSSHPLIQVLKENENKIEETYERLPKKIKNKTSFLKSYLNVGKLRCIVFHDMVDQIELDLGYKDGKIMFMLYENFNIKCFSINHYSGKIAVKSIEDIVDKAKIMEKLTKDYKEAIKMKDEVDRRIDYVLKLKFAGSHEKFKEIQEKEGSYKDRILTPYKG